MTTFFAAFAGAFAGIVFGIVLLAALLGPPKAEWQETPVDDGMPKDFALDEIVAAQRTDRRNI